MYALDNFSIIENVIFTDQSKYTGNMSHASHQLNMPSNTLLKKKWSNIHVGFGTLS